MSSFGGIMKEYKECSLDRFDGRNLQSTAFFLSHFHKDHMVGLTSKRFANHLHSNRQYKLYCSLITHRYLRTDPRTMHLEPYTVILHVGGKVDIDVLDRTSGKLKYIVQVTTIDANHCPGSVMFRFLGPEGSVLYTGDFRMDDQDIRRVEALHYGDRPVRLDAIYMDTTFCKPQAMHIPSRNESAQAAIAVARDWLGRGERYHVHIVSKARLGYEQLYRDMARALGMKVHVCRQKFIDYSARLPNPGEFCTTLPTRLHACKWKDFTDHPGQREKALPCCGVSSIVAGVSHSVMTIQLSTMAFVEQIGWDKIAKMQHSRLYKVCYSNHSSYSELQGILKYLKPARAYANVIPIGEDKKTIEYRLLGMINQAKKPTPSYTERPLGMLQLPERSNGEPSCSNSDLDFDDSQQKDKKPATTSLDITDQQTDEQVDYQNFLKIVKKGSVGQNCTYCSDSDDDDEDENESKEEEAVLEEEDDNVVFINEETVEEEAEEEDENSQVLVDLSFKENAHRPPSSSSAEKKDSTGTGDNTMKLLTSENTKTQDSSIMELDASKSVETKCKHRNSTDPIDLTADSDEEEVVSSEEEEEALMEDERVETKKRKRIESKEEELEEAPPPKKAPCNEQIAYMARQQRITQNMMAKNKERKSKGPIYLTIESDEEEEEEVGSFQEEEELMEDDSQVDSAAINPLKEEEDSIEEENEEDDDMAFVREDTVREETEEEDDDSEVLVDLSSKENNHRSQSRICDGVRQTFLNLAAYAATKARNWGLPATVHETLSTYSQYNVDGASDDSAVTEQSAAEKKTDDKKKAVTGKDISGKEGESEGITEKEGESEGITEKECESEGITEKEGESEGITGKEGEGKTISDGGKSNGLENNKSTEDQQQAQKSENKDCEKGTNIEARQTEKDKSEKDNKKNESVEKASSSSAEKIDSTGTGDNTMELTSEDTKTEDSSVMELDASKIEETKKRKRRESKEEELEEAPPTKKTSCNEPNSSDVITLDSGDEEEEEEEEDESEEEEDMSSELESDEEFSEEQIAYMARQQRIIQNMMAKKKHHNSTGPIDLTAESDEEEEEEEVGSSEEEEEELMEDDSEVDSDAINALEEEEDSIDEDEWQMAYQQLKRMKKKQKLRQSQMAARSSDCVIVVDSSDEEAEKDNQEGEKTQEKKEEKKDETDAKKNEKSVDNKGKAEKAQEKKSAPEGKPQQERAEAESKDGKSDEAKKQETDPVPEKKNKEEDDDSSKVENDKDKEEEKNNKAEDNAAVVEEKDGVADKPNEASKEASNEASKSSNEKVVDAAIKASTTEDAADGASNQASKSLNEKVVDAAIKASTIEDAADIEEKEMKEENITAAEKTDDTLDDLLDEDLLKSDGEEGPAVDDDINDAEIDAMLKDLDEKEGKTSKEKGGGDEEKDSAIEDTE